MKMYEGQLQNNVSCSFISCGSQKTHMQIKMFMTTALKAFFKFSYSIEDEQNGKGLDLVFK